MEKKAPTALQGLVIVGFVLSCFGLALLLWISFGGPTPLRPQSYEIKVPVREATQLAEQSDVRISGVNVGKVANIDLPPAGGEAIATLSIDERFAPLPADIKATLRAKTLLGETYIELTPGTADGPQLAEGATLPAAQVAPTIQLDEILRTFDPKTRAALRTWLRDSAIAIHGRGPTLSNSFALLEPTFSGFDKIFRTLGTQETAVRQLFANGATTFDALSRRRGELRSLISSSNAVVQTTARRDQDLIAAFRAFPTFLNESRLTLARLRSFSLERRPARRAARARGPSALPHARGPRAPGAGAARLLQRLRAGDRPRPAGLPGRPPPLPRRLPAAPALGRPVPAPAQPDPRRDRLLQARGQRAGRQRRRDDERGLAGQGREGPLPADAQPPQPGVGRDLSEAAADQPQHRLLEARRLLAPRQGPAELRRPPVHGGHERAARSVGGRPTPPSPRARTATSPRPRTSSTASSSSPSATSSPPTTSPTRRAAPSRPRSHPSGTRARRPTTRTPSASRSGAAGHRALVRSRRG